MRLIPFCSSMNKSNSVTFFPYSFLSSRCSVRKPAKISTPYISYLCTATVLCILCLNDIRRRNHCNTKGNECMGFTLRWYWYWRSSVSSRRAKSRVVVSYIYSSKVMNIGSMIILNWLKFARCTKYIQTDWQWLNPQPEMQPNSFCLNGSTTVKQSKNKTNPLMCALYVHHNMVEYRILINRKRVERMIVRDFMVAHSYS